MTPPPDYAREGRTLLMPADSGVEAHCENRLLLQSSGLFDAAWYVAKYPDVAELGIDPVEHYLLVGAAERRSPGPQFDAPWYLDQNPDVSAAKVNPLLHYLRHGVSEGRAPRASRACRMAREDIAHQPGRAFSYGSKPVIRWIKGDGRDDDVTRSAIGQATRLFGDAVDYCLCTAEISPSRARAVLAWAQQPVEWWPIESQDNASLSAALMGAGCYPDRFGYWWKWFPERVRTAAPEWILDGDWLCAYRFAASISRSS